jgi:hypothetical protein
MYAQGTSDDTRVPVETASYVMHFDIRANIHPSLDLSLIRSSISFPGNLTPSHHHHPFLEQRPLSSLDQTDRSDELYTAEV